MKFPLLLRTCIFFMLLSIAAVSNATDYYVSAAGNDSNNGTSAATPWKSLTKVESISNAGTIHAGDRILFKCGDSFTGKVSISSLWGHTAKSGTAANPITLGSYGTGAKPVFLYPQGGSLVPESRYLLYFVGVDYWVIDGLNFTDTNTSNNHITGANNGIPIYLGSYGDAPCNHWLIQNVDISLCGMGVVIVGDYNTIQNCNMSNFKNLKSTPNTGGSTAWEDYGANPFTLIWANNNLITHNNVSGGWAESMDFGYNGGFCETIGACSSNEISYNTIVDCNGLSEFGQGGNSANNLYAYNKMIDCGAMFWVNADCQVTNAQFFNNTIIETTNSRFAQGSPNAGAGVVSAEALSHLNVDAYMFDYSGSSQTASTVFNLKNNIIQISNPLKITKSGSKLFHDYNVLKLSGGSSLGQALNSHDKSTSAIIFSNTNSATPELWDMKPPAGSPPIDAGTDVGFDADFIGNPVPTVPNAGILESSSAVSTLVVSSAAGSISCNGGTTTVAVTASGGTTPYSGTGTYTVTAGTYSYNVTDATGTVKSTSVTVTQPLVLHLSITAGTIAVYGGTTTITASASGGTSPYTYKLNNGSSQSGSSFSGVVAGTHTVTATDSKGCVSTNNITITQPAQVLPLTVASACGVINCNGGSTSVMVTAAGGVAPYSGTGTFTVTAGTYSYNITDAAGAIKTTSITVTQPSALNITMTAGTIAVFGGTTTITASVSGGTPTYSYKLNNGSLQSGNSFTGVIAGTYTITAIDSKGCIAISNITVTQPAQIPPLNAVSTSGVINCNGGFTSVVVVGTGGVAPYTGTGTFTVTAGTYSYAVTDANGSTASTTITIAQPSAIIPTLSAGTITVYGGTTTISVAATGGTGVYTYRLNNGSYQSGNLFISVSAGTHTISVKDANGCIATNTIIIAQPSAPEPLTVSASTGTISCNGGTASIVVSAAGGITPYNGTGIFTVSAGTYNYTVTDANGQSATTAVVIAQPAIISPSISAGTITVYGGTTSATIAAAGGTGIYSYQLDGGTYQSSNSFTNILAGNHTVTVKDANGCTALKNFILTQPAAVPLLIASASATTINCNGENAIVTVMASGGTAPYNGTGTFAVVAGNFVYTVTDAVGASASTSVNVSQPSAIDAILNAGTITVYGGTTSITVLANGGSESYSYKLDTGSYQSSDIFTAVAAGNHTITVKDANGCTLVKAINIKQPVNNPLTVTGTFTAINCNGDISTVSITASGGTAPYTGTGLLTAYAGTYTYIVTDAAGASVSAVLTITQPAIMTATITAGTVTQAGGTTTASVSASGGTAPYVYSLDAGAYQEANSFSGLTAGGHSLTIRDGHGCTSIKTFTITSEGNQNLRIALLARTNVVCRGGNTGLIKVQATGGTAPYTYQLNNGRYSSINTFSNLVAGLYRVNARDASGNIVALVTYIFDGRVVCTGRTGSETLNITAFPNPTADHFSLSIESGNAADVIVEVMNLTGRKVFEGKGSLSKKYVFGEHFIPGTYFVKVTQGKDVLTTKLVKVN